MDRATFEKQKAFAGEKKPSMQRRCVDNDYTQRRMYMITMVTEGRKPLFGKVVALQMMPDHLHAILFVKERLKKPLGKVLLGVKQACNQVFREVMPEAFVAVAQQHAER
ncbi:MAG: hypothetical protein IJ633_00655 [Prevotella sp.]|nr:hypothetical protein [Prevotella sp.]